MNVQVTYHQNQKYMVDPEGNIYRHNKFSKYWKCVKTNVCTGTMLIKGDGLVYSGQLHAVTCRPNVRRLEDIRYFEKLRLMCENNMELKFLEIYNHLQQEYPNATHAHPYNSVKRNMVRWRYPGLQRLPTTLDELHTLMQEPFYYKHYGTRRYVDIDDESTELDEDDVFYEGLYEVETIDAKKGVVRSKIVAFKSSVGIRVFRGRVVRVAGDGTFSVRPRARAFGSKVFDGVRQLFAVHVIVGKKFFPIAYFLLQHTTQDVMEKVFNLVKKWLGPETVIESFMSDYDRPARNALKTVWPHLTNDKIKGCSIHFQRAVGMFARKLNVYSKNANINLRRLTSLAYGLCFLPAQLIDVGVEVIESESIGDCIDYGSQLVMYLRKNWIAECISVAEEDVRTNNGCESWHWAIQRQHNWLKNNIMDFLVFLRKVDSKASTEICQFQSVTTSNKQRQLDDYHKLMQNKLQDELTKIPQFEAVSHFLNQTMSITKSTQEFFEKLPTRKTTDDDEDIDFHELFITDKRSTSTSSSVLAPTQQLTILLEGVPNEEQKIFFTKKELTVSSSNPVTIAKATVDDLATPRNSFISCPTVSLKHAEFKCIDFKLYVRDCGSIHGTFVNGHRIARSGVQGPPKLLVSGDKIQFGTALAEIKIKEHLPTSISTTQKHRNIVCKIRFNVIYGDQPISARYIEVANLEEFVIGKATQQSPATSTNALFKSDVKTSIKQKHATMWCTNQQLFIKPYNLTLVDDELIEATQQLKNGSIITMGNKYSQQKIEFMVSFTLLNINESIANDLEPTLHLSRCDTIHPEFANKSIKFDSSNRIFIGRSTAEVGPTTTNGLFNVPSISLNHASFAYSNGKIYLQDNQSQKGTFLNNEKIQHPMNAIVEPQQIVQFGSTSGSDYQYVRAMINITFARPTSETSDFICPFPECGLQSFCTKTLLDAHIHQCHHISPSPQRTSFECTTCQKSFRLEVQLKNHSDKHHVESSTSEHFICPFPECGLQSFTSKTLLDTHIEQCHRTSMPLTPFSHQCTICGRKFRWQLQLQLHITKNHNGPSPSTSTISVCVECDKKFRTEQQLLLHKNKYHPTNTN